MVSMRVQALGTGRIVNWRALKRGALVETSCFARWWSITTTLPDVITDLCTLAESYDSAYRVVTVVPNGPTCVSLDLALLSGEFEIMCSRRLIRGLFPWNPLAAEFGSNYDVVVTVTAPSAELQSSIVTFLKSKYPCTLIE